jgi:UDP-N-acetylmuramoylalanine-D-glutamate ligase
MNVAIIGFGVEGQSAVRYWYEQGHAITVCDQKRVKKVYCLGRTDSALPFVL